MRDLAVRRGAATRRVRGPYSTRHTSAFRRRASGLIASCGRLKSDAIRDLVQLPVALDNEFDTDRLGHATQTERNRSGNLIAVRLISVRPSTRSARKGRRDP
jgi:hypothetical protein